ncbi:hypothetical protein CAXC1_20023 [Candidatus Xenohaliotis californiensis]|uniref:Helicase ATP-binding domain-containing protein n=1 Tax=Candidatus Xenohaliotis californiensis TaxID=84677 RepID=A0ABP0EXI2_9RICK|nr:hypothetical protein CAXC1_20023 [Candidatus Xenohaliotis californiensis]
MFLGGAGLKLFYNQHIDDLVKFLLSLNDDDRESCALIFRANGSGKTFFQAMLYSVLWLANNPATLVVWNSGGLDSQMMSDFSRVLSPELCKEIFFLKHKNAKEEFIKRKPEYLLVKAKDLFEVDGIWPVFSEFLKEEKPFVFLDESDRMFLDEEYKQKILDCLLKNTPTILLTATPNSHAVNIGKLGFCICMNFSDKEKLGMGAIPKIVVDSVADPDTLSRKSATINKHIECFMPYANSSDRLILESMRNIKSSWIDKNFIQKISNLNILFLEHYALLKAMDVEFREDLLDKTMLKSKWFQELTEEEKIYRVLRSCLHASCHKKDLVIVQDAVQIKNAIKAIYQHYYSDTDKITEYSLQLEAYNGLRKLGFNTKPRGFVFDDVAGSGDLEHSIDFLGEILSADCSSEFPRFLHSSLENLLCAITDLDKIALDEMRMGGKFDELCLMVVNALHNESDVEQKIRNYLKKLGIVFTGDDKIISTMKNLADLMSNAIRSDYHNFQLFVDNWPLSAELKDLLREKMCILYIQDMPSFYSKCFIINNINSDKIIINGRPFAVNFDCESMDKCSACPFDEMVADALFKAGFIQQLITDTRIAGYNDVDLQNLAYVSCGGSPNMHDPANIVQAVGRLRGLNARQTSTAFLMPATQQEVKKIEPLIRSPNYHEFFLELREDFLNRFGKYFAQDILTRLYSFALRTGASSQIIGASLKQSLIALYECLYNINDHNDKKAHKQFKLFLCELKDRSFIVKWHAKAVHVSAYAIAKTIYVVGFVSYRIGCLLDFIMKPLKSFFYADLRVDPRIVAIVDYNADDLTKFTKGFSTVSDVSWIGHDIEKYESSKLANLFFADGVNADYDRLIAWLSWALAAIVCPDITSANTLEERAIIMRFFQNTYNRDMLFDILKNTTASLGANRFTSLESALFYAISAVLDNGSERSAKLLEIINVSVHDLHKKINDAKNMLKFSVEGKDCELFGVKLSYEQCQMIDLDDICYSGWLSLQLKLEEVATGNEFDWKEFTNAHHNPGQLIAHINRTVDIKDHNSYLQKCHGEDSSLLCGLDFMLSFNEGSFELMCDIASCYFYAMPVDASVFRRWLEDLRYDVTHMSKDDLFSKYFATPEQKIAWHQKSNFMKCFGKAFRKISIPDEHSMRKNYVQVDTSEKEKLLAIITKHLVEDHFMKMLQHCLHSIRNMSVSTLGNTRHCIDTLHNIIQTIGLNDRTINRLLDIFSREKVLTAMDSKVCYEMLIDNAFDCLSNDATVIKMSEFLASNYYTSANINHMLSSGSYYNSFNIQSIIGSKDKMILESSLGKKLQKVGLGIVLESHGFSNFADNAMLTVAACNMIHAASIGLHKAFNISDDEHYDLMNIDFSDGCTLFAQQVDERVGLHNASDDNERKIGYDIAASVIDHSMARCAMSTASKEEQRSSNNVSSVGVSAG